jgi:hypothetical protein
MVFQDFKLLPNRTVYDNVAYAIQVTGGRRKEIRSKVPDILRLTGLSTKLHNYPDQLSGGEQQRVAIARAFVNHPPLLLADEPTGNLDPETSIGIMQLLYRINRTGTTRWTLSSSSRVDPTVRAGLRVVPGSWNTIWMARRVARSRWTPSGAPRNRISPAASRLRPITARISVDLPEPDWPTTKTNSPRLMVRVTLSSPTSPPS